MSVDLVRGGPDPDAECLHCVLPPVISDFLRSHPQYQERGGVQAIIDIGMVLGEFIASGLINSGRRDQLDVVFDLAFKEARRSALELIETMDRRRS